MLFIGAADYFFWEGVGKGVNNTIDNLPQMINNKFLMNNPTTIACTDAFIWGFMFGLEFSQDEIFNLTTENETSIIKITTQVVKRQKLQPNHNGNC